MVASYLLALLVIPGGAVSHAGSASPSSPGLRVGGIELRLGMSESDARRPLETDHTLRRIEGGWEARHKSGSSAKPAIVLLVEGDRLQGVTLIWFAGSSPSLPEVFEPLVTALPKRSECRLSTSTSVDKVGTLSSLRADCDGYRVDVNVGHTEKGTAATIRLGTTDGR